MKCFPLRFFTLAVAGLAFAPLGAESRFGLNHIVPANMSTLANLGIGWNRPRFSAAVWHQVEASSGATYDWTDLDAEVSDSQASGLKLLYALFPYADWDQSVCHATPSTDSSTTPHVLNSALHPDLGEYLREPCDMAAASSFVEAVIDRYNYDGTNDMSGLTEAVAHWQISNEPSVHLDGTEYFWYGDESKYTPVLQWGYDVINTFDSSMIVMNGGMASMESITRTYWTNVLTYASSYVEIFTFHSIGQASVHVDSRVDEVRTFLDGLGMTSTEIWVTELELDSSNYGTSFDKGKAAQRLVEVHVRTFAAGAEKIFLAGKKYDLGNIYSNPSGTETDEFALLEYDSSGTVVTTIVYDAMKIMIDKIDEFTLVEEVVPGELYRFEFSGGTEVWAALHPTADHSTGIVSSSTTGVVSGDTLTATDLTGTTFTETVGSMSVHGDIRFYEP